MNNIKNMLMEAHTIVSRNGDEEAYRVLSCEEDGVRVEGEESGEDFLLSYDEISLDTHLIYKLSLMNPQES